MLCTRLKTGQHILPDERAFRLLNRTALGRGWPGRRSHGGFSVVVFGGGGGGASQVAEENGGTAPVVTELW